jgi:serine/threonine-protein kinase ATR
MYDRLQEIYTQIEEPDGLEGIAAHLPLVTEDQQAIHHAKAGRWTAAQAWYELQLAEYPGDTPLQHGLLQCLRETGQFAPLLRYANSFLGPGLNGCDSDFTATAKTHLPATVEACWMTENFDELRKKLELEPHGPKPDFNIGVGQFLLHTRATPTGPVVDQIVGLRRSIAEGLSMASTSSLQTCHDELVKLHVLYELEAMACADAVGTQQQLLRNFDRRLNAVGAYIQDKQYILGVRRAMMGLLPNKFIGMHIRPLWLTTARLARQSKNIASAYNAVLKAYDLGDPGAKVEEARLLWHEGHQRQAIQALEAAIDSGVLEGDDSGIGANVDSGVSITTASGIAEINGYKQNPLLGKALLLLAKWLDASGQSQTKDMTDRYQVAARRHQRWEKGHYYLGKHYSKLLDAQKALPREKQSQPFLTGELTKLVIDNSLRSIPFGNKYWHETIPRVLTLWLQLGMDAHIKTRQEDQATFDKRVRSLQACNRQLQKYFERVPAYVFYHALPQLISRITHPHPEVWKQLSNILTRIASTHPSQTLWSLFAVIKATDSLRRERGQEILTKLKDPKNRTKNDTSGIDLRATIIQGQRLCDGLLLACERPIEARSVACSLFKTLEFSAKLAPSNLVVPVEANLVASPPAAANSESIRRHKAFTQDRVTIQSFLDEVLVLNSLQRPRKITIRGSDGKLYGILCKPKDDLRKDQRLMEFNGIINRALKRNTESSKRRLYIKTYAVTPLSEESGSIEWVEGIKPMRDILLNLYSRRGVRPNYNDIKKTLDAASQAPEHAHLFAEEVLNQFSPVLHEWFTETYPEPEVWFNARIRYARSAAVMSMVGHILGLGDRHGENILLEESTGGVFHVDFNCLFDKGLTFEKPELVPFRLTHNMVDAMGPYGYEGPFRKSSELTLGLLRQERDTLMTVLETFLYDPTTDFVDKKKKKTSHAGVPDTPKEILESVATKLKGLLRGETVPLSVEGYVDALCQQATSHFHLASMYIGEWMRLLWCSGARLIWCHRLVFVPMSFGSRRM